MATENEVKGSTVLDRELPLPWPLTMSVVFDPPRVHSTGTRAVRDKKRINTEFKDMGERGRLSAAGSKLMF